VSENAPTTSAGSASGRDRSDLFGAGGLWLAKWSAVLLVVSAAL